MAVFLVAAKSSLCAVCQKLLAASILQALEGGGEQVMGVVADITGVWAWSAHGGEDTTTDVVIIPPRKTHA